MLPADLENHSVREVIDDLDLNEREENVCSDLEDTF